MRQELPINTKDEACAKQRDASLTWKAGSVCLSMAVIAYVWRLRPACGEQQAVADESCVDCTQLSATPHAMIDQQAEVLSRTF